MSTYSVVSCSEEHGTISESANNKTGWDCKVTLRCPWDSRHDLIKDVLKNRRPCPHGTFSEPPQAASASCVPALTKYTEVGQSCEYLDALVTVNYSTEIKDLISESLEPSISFLTLDWRRFRWGAKDGDPILEAEAPGRQVRSLTLVRTLHEVDPPLPISLITLAGSVNDEKYTSDLLGLEFEAETLLYQPPSLSRTIKSDGNKAFQLVLKFAFQEQGWNKFWRAKTETHEHIFDVENNANYKNYPPNDFSDFLF